MQACSPAPVTAAACLHRPRRRVAAIAAASSEAVPLLPAPVPMTVAAAAVLAAGLEDGRPPVAAAWLVVFVVIGRVAVLQVRVALLCCFKVAMRVAVIVAALLPLAVRVAAAGMLAGRCGGRVVGTRVGRAELSRLQHGCQLALGSTLAMPTALLAPFAVPAAAIGAVRLRRQGAANTV